MKRRCSMIAASILMSLAAHAAQAQEPDPARSNAPQWILVVGMIHGGASPDPVGLTQVTVRDASGQPIAGAQVKIDFSGCCDIALCADQPDLDAAAGIKRGTSNGSGVYSFTVIGAGRDPGNIIPCGPHQGDCVYHGCGLDGLAIYANTGGGDVLLGRATGVCLDQNGASALGQSNGVTASDPAAVATLFGTTALGQPYKGRGDISMNGVVTAYDVSLLWSHLGRLNFQGGVGCPSGTWAPAPAACP